MCQKLGEVSQLFYFTLITETNSAAASTLQHPTFDDLLQTSSVPQDSTLSTVHWAKVCAMTQTSKTTSCFAGAARLLT